MGEETGRQGRSRGKATALQLKSHNPKQNSLGTEDTNTASTKERKRGGLRAMAGGAGKVQSGEDEGWRRGHRNRAGRERRSGKERDREKGKPA